MLKQGLNEVVRAVTQCSYLENQKELNNLWNFDRFELFSLSKVVS
jgi:hypothetical protein